MWQITERTQQYYNQLLSSHHIITPTNGLYRYDYRYLQFFNHFGHK